MTGPVDWAVLIFLGSIAIGSMGIAWGAAWRVRGMIAAYELKFDLALAGLQRAIEDRNFLIKYELAIADLTKDVRHMKANLDHHSIIYQEMHDDLLKAKEEVTRLGKIVNGVGKY